MTRFKFWSVLDGYCLVNMTEGKSGKYEPKQTKLGILSLTEQSLKSQL